MPVDTKNAHIRSDPVPSSVEGAAQILADAESLLNDPRFKRLIEDQRTSLIVELERIEHDGSIEVQNRQDEICRELRLWKRLRISLAHKRDLAKANKSNLEARAAAQATPSPTNERG